MSEYILNINVNSSGNAEIDGNIAPPSESTQSKISKQEKIISNAIKVQKLGIVRQIFKYEMGTVGVRTGNSDLQDKIDYSMNTAGKVAAIAGAFLISPAVGALAVVSEGISIAQKFDSYYMHKRWNDIGLAQERLRAGASYNRSRGGQGGY